LATGVLGLALQQMLPRLLKESCPEGEVPYEQIPHVCELLRREADRAVEKARDNQAIDEKVRAELAAFYSQQVRPFLGARAGRSPAAVGQGFDFMDKEPRFEAVREVLTELKTAFSQRQRLRQQEQMFHALHGWLLVHVPLSVLLLVLGLIHAVMSVYY
jgi:hypothetical protein